MGRLEGEGEGEGEREGERGERWRGRERRKRGRRKGGKRRSEKGREEGERERKVRFMGPHPSISFSLSLSPSLSSQPCKLFMKPEDVHFMFNEMVQRSEQLFFSPVDSAVDDKLLHLPAFLEALASIVKEMEQVREGGRRMFLVLFSPPPLVTPLHPLPHTFSSIP